MDLFLKFNYYGSLFSAKQSFQRLDSVRIYSLLIRLLDLRINLLAVDWHILGCADAQLYLLSLDFEYGYLNVIVYDQGFIFLSG